MGRVELARKKSLKRLDVGSTQNADPSDGQRDIASNPFTVMSRY